MVSEVVEPCSSSEEGEAEREVRGKMERDHQRKQRRRIEDTTSVEKCEFTVRKVLTDISSLINEESTSHSTGE